MKILTTLALSALLTLGCSMTGQVQAEDDYFTQAELDSMLAPVALYPDSVLSHVLIAATYPLEVIQAARWSREHPGLRGEEAVAAVEYQNWDASVKALVAFPDLLERMDADLQWTQNLGDAFLVQEEEVIASIQYLRSDAYSQGHLRSNDRVKVVREKEYIYIQPARSRVVYVPYYDPRVVYSSWRWSSYPPVYWQRPHGFSVNLSFHWGRPYHLRPSFYFSSFHWPTHRVVVVNHHHYYNQRRFHSGRQVAQFEHARHWKHNPVHRRGVSYRGRVEQTRFVDNSRPASARVESSRQRTVARAEQREWAADKRRSSIDFDRQRATSRASASRSERVAELRGRNSDRASSRSTLSRSGEGSRTASRASDRSSSRAVGRTSSRTSDSRASDRASLSRGRDGDQRSDSRSDNRTISGRAPARVESRGRGDANARSSAGRSSRVSESLRSSGRSTSRSSGRSSVSERSEAALRSLSKQRSTTTRSSRSGSERSSVRIPPDLTVRSGRDRGASSSRSRSSSSRGATIGRSSTPTRRSSPAPRSSGRREAAPSRSMPQQRSAPSQPSRSSSAPSRSSRSESRSSRGSASSRSRGGDSRRGGGEERR